METTAEKTSNEATATRFKTLKKEDPYRYEIACANMSQEIPYYWADRPREWFINFESYMAVQNKEDDDLYKFQTVLYKLKDDEAIIASSAVIVTPPKEGKYEALKNILLNVPFHTNKRIAKILNDLGISNSKLAEPVTRPWTECRKLCELMPCNDSSSSSSEGVQVVGDKGGWLCWYHWKFGANSTKCDDLVRCTYKKKCARKIILLTMR